MKLKRLLLKYFLSHKDTVIYFDDNSTTYFYGINHDGTEIKSNGAGKSSILYGIVWALFGVIPHPDYHSKNDVISHGAEAAHVELDLTTDDGALLRVIRTKPAKGSEKVRALLNRQPLPDPVQQSLEKMYGISYPVFCNCFFLGPNSPVTQFVKATAGERAKILGELINDEAFQTAAERVNADLSKITTERDNHLSIFRSLQVTQDTCRGNIQRLQESYVTEQQQQRRAEEKVQLQVGAVEQQILQAQDKLRNRPQKDLATTQGMLNILQEEQEKVQASMAAARARIEAKPPQVGEECSQCGQTFGTDHKEVLEERKGSLRESYSLFHKRLTAINGRMHDVRAEITELTQWNSVEKSILREIDLLKAQAYALKNSLENRTLAILHKEREAAEKAFKEASKMMEERQKAIAEGNLQIPILKTLHQGFKTEIRNMLLDDIRKVLEFYSSQYVMILAEHEFTLEFPPTSSTGREKFEIVVKSNGQDNPLTSGGESYRAQLSILLALRKALTHQAKCPFRFLLVDEALTHTDDTGGRAFGRLMQMLQGDFSQILITSPREIEGVSGNSVYVTRRDRVSFIGSKEG